MKTNIEEIDITMLNLNNSDIKIETVYKKNLIIKHEENNSNKIKKYNFNINISKKEYEEIFDSSQEIIFNQYDCEMIIKDNKNEQFYIGNYHKITTRENDDYTLFSINNVNIYNLLEPIKYKQLVNFDEYINNKIENNILNKIENNMFRLIIESFIRLYNIKNINNNLRSENFLLNKNNKLEWNFIFNGLNEIIKFDFENNFPILLNNLSTNKTNKNERLKINERFILNLKKEGYEFITYKISNDNKLIKIIDFFEYPNKDIICSFNISTQYFKFLNKKYINYNNKKLEHFEMPFTEIELNKSFEYFNIENKPFEYYKESLIKYLNFYNFNLLNSKTDLNEDYYPLLEKNINTDLYFFSSKDKNRMHSIQLNNFEIEKINIDESIIKEKKFFYYFNVYKNNEILKLMYIEDYKGMNFHYEKMPFIFYNYLQLPFNIKNNFSNSDIQLHYKFENEINYISSPIGLKNSNFLVETNKNNKYQLNFIGYSIGETQNINENILIEKNYRNSINNIHIEEIKFYNKLENLFNISNNLISFKTDETLYTINKNYTKKNLTENPFLIENQNKNEINIKLFLNMEKLSNKFKLNNNISNNYNYYILGNQIRTNIKNNFIFEFNFNFDINILTLEQEEGLIHMDKYKKYIKSINLKITNNEQIENLNIKNIKTFLDLFEPFLDDDKIFKLDLNDYKIKELYKRNIVDKIEFKYNDNIDVKFINDNKNKNFIELDKTKIGLFFENVNTNDKNNIKKMFLKDFDIKRVFNNKINIIYNKKELIFLKNINENLENSINFNQMSIDNSQKTIYSFKDTLKNNDSFLNKENSSLFNIDSSNIMYINEDLSFGRINNLNKILENINFGF